MMKGFASGSNLSYKREKVRSIITIWISRRRRPYSIVSDPEFIALLKMLNNQVKIPSRVTVSCDVQMLYKLTRVKVQRRLKVS
jgi:hypothetical protein